MTAAVGHHINLPCQPHKNNYLSVRNITHPNPKTRGIFRPQALKVLRENKLQSGTSNTVWHHE